MSAFDPKRTKLALAFFFRNGSGYPGFFQRRGTHMASFTFLWVEGNQRIVPMTDHHNPDPNRPIEPRDPRTDENWGSGSVIMGSLFAIALMMGLAMMYNYETGGRSVTASNVERTTPAPAAPRVTPRETTGSGVSSGQLR